MARIDQLYDQGEKFREEGEYEEAIAKFNQCLEEDEAFALAHFALAVVYGKVGRHEDAVRHGRRAVELEPEDPFSHTAMSITYQKAFAATQNREFIRLAEEAMYKANALQARR
jgi:tetratricopeptide (TPR) repeat protein